MKVMKNQTRGKSLATLCMVCGYIVKASETIMDTVGHRPQVNMKR